MATQNDIFSMIKLLNFDEAKAMCAGIVEPSDGHLKHKSNVLVLRTKPFEEGEYDEVIKPVLKQTNPDEVIKPVLKRTNPEKMLKTANQPESVPFMETSLYSLIKCESFMGDLDPTFIPVDLRRPKVIKKDMSTLIQSMVIIKSLKTSLLTNNQALNAISIKPLINFQFIFII